MEPKPNKARSVVAIPGADRPEDALKYLQEALANEKPDGVILITVTKGKADSRFFGALLRSELAWIGATISYEAVRED